MNYLYILWNPDVIAFSLGPVEIRWYSLCWCMGLLSVYMLMHELFHQQKLKEEQFDPMFLYCFLGILIGARLGHCLFYEPEYFLTSGVHFIEMLIPFRQLADGSWKFTGYEGLASHGGTIGLTIALWLYARKVGLRFIHVLDNVAVVTPICACFIRLGNLMNSEIIGKVTDVPWAFIFARVDMQPRHPGQLYEAICYAIFFFVLWWFYRRSLKVSEFQKVSSGSMFKVGSGFYFGLCIFMIFTARIFIELTKENQEAFESGMLLNMGQLLSIPFIVAGAYFVWRAHRNSKLEIQNSI